MGVFVRQSIIPVTRSRGKDSCYKKRGCMNAECDCIGGEEGEELAEEKDFARRRRRWGSIRGTFVQW